MGNKKFQISKVKTENNKYIQEEIFPDIPMSNGGVNYQDGVLFCCQGTYDKPSSLVHMEISPPYSTKIILDSFHGREFNSINDAIIHSDGSIGFTDPIYGYEQGFRPQPQLPVSFRSRIKLNPSNNRWIWKTECSLFLT